MTTFDDREKAFEDRFAHDQELKFLIQARCGKKLATWAAEVMKLNLKDKELYIQRILALDLKERSLKAVLSALEKDLKEKGYIADSQTVKLKAETFLKEAQDELMKK